MEEIIDSISDAKLLSEYESFVLLEIVPPTLAPPNPSHPRPAPESSTVPTPPYLAARPRVGYPTSDRGHKRRNQIKFQSDLRKGITITTGNTF